MADVSVIAVGHGSTLSFGTFAAPIRSIGGFTQDREAVDAGHLAMDGFTKKVPAGLAEPGSFECEFIFDANNHTDWATVDMPDPTGSAGACVVTFPQGAHTTSAALVSGTAFCTSWTTPELTSDGLMTGSVTLQWEGGGSSVFTWTKGA